MIIDPQYPYVYRVYGLIIKSQIKIPELKSVDYDNIDKCDAAISCEEIPINIKEPILKSQNCEISKTEFYMYVKGAAHYYVAGGNKVIIKLDEVYDMEKVRVYLLGSTLGFMMIQRNMVAIHGGAVAVSGIGIILTGGMGAGKSTLNAAFRNEGHPFLSDDVSALEVDSTGKLLIQPAYPQVKLCEDTMVKMQYDLTSFNVVNQERNKYAVPITKAYLDKPVLLGGIYEITVGDVRSVEIMEITGSEKLTKVINNLYRVEISRYVGFDREYFKKCLMLAKQIPIYKLIRPRDKFTVKEQMDLIKSTLKLEAEKVI